MSERAAGFIIYRVLENIEFLLLQASYGIYHWTPPKGHLESEESNLDAAFRECEEETGIPSNILSVKEFTKILQYEVKGKQKEVFYWLAELSDKNYPVKLSDEHKDFRWAQINEACKLAQFDNLQNLLQECYDFLTCK